MTGETLHLSRDWVVGDQIGGGGFGDVYDASADGVRAAAKFIPQAPGADRELLFVDLEDPVNVVPIIDSGEHEGYWVLVMPKAEDSLRGHMNASGGSLDVATAVTILVDVVDALVSLDGRVVHRDLKPENVLLIDGKWCLADFGISRYAEATTAPDTQKFAMSPPYAAPERWRHERAQTATDVYAVGVMAYEMISGERPFRGPDWEDYQEQHLHATPPTLTSTPAQLGALINECLFKAPGARPSAENLRARLGSAQAEPPSSGLAALVDANREEVERQAAADRTQSRERSAAQARSDLADAGRSSFNRIAAELSLAITSVAPSAVVESARHGWKLTLGSAVLSLSEPRQHPASDWGGWEAPAFDVILYADLSLRIPPNRAEYEGRSHSLWFCDPAAEGEFKWYETAFMISPMIPRRGRQNPFALAPGEEAAKAVWTGVADYQLAWPFTPLLPGALDDFIDRWASWLADASQGRLSHPSRMPEQDGSQDSFRKA